VRHDAECPAARAVRPPCFGPQIHQDPSLSGDSVVAHGERELQLAYL